MKNKLLIILLIIILLTGCTSNSLSKEKETYIKYIKELKEVKKTSMNIPFDIEVKYDKLIKDEVRYQVIIDNVKEDIYDIEALCIHNKETNDIFPSIGIFDDKETLLLNNKPKGVILVGYIDYMDKLDSFKCNLKLLIKYKTKDKNCHKVYYVTKK